MHTQNSSDKQACLKAPQEHEPAPCTPRPERCTPNPAAGLDARAANIVMRCVKSIVQTGRTIVSTIHQPSIDIFEQFDELVLLKRGGETIYCGPLGLHSKELIAYFEVGPSRLNAPAPWPSSTPGALCMGSGAVDSRRRGHACQADLLSKHGKALGMHTCRVHTPVHTVHAGRCAGQGVGHDESSGRPGPANNKHGPVQLPPCTLGHVCLMASWACRE